MPGLWLVGDTHFGHEKVSQIRGFDSTAAHDESIVQRWSKAVQSGDRVIVLGDISSGSASGEVHALGILASLPGSKWLIAGNHDSVSGIHRKPSPREGLFRDVFDRVTDYGRLRIEGRDIALSHFPYKASGDGPGRGEARYGQFRLPDEGGLLVHAHTHHTVAVNGREMCVSWDAWRRMVNLGDIAHWVKGVA